MYPGSRSGLLTLCVTLLLCISATAEAAGPSTTKSVKHAAGFSAGWPSGSGITYRRIIGKHFVQTTLFGISSDNGDNTYVNAAIAAGTYLHKKAATRILPPLGLKVMVGADWVLERRQSVDSTAPTMIRSYDKSYYGGGVGLDIGNPGSAGLSVWLAANYVVGFDGLSFREFESFSILPSAGILYGW